MKKILWISRHPLSEESLEALRKKFGKFTVDTINGLFPANGKQAYKLLEDFSMAYDIVGGVFPAQLWIQIAKHGFSKEIFIVKSVPTLAKDGTTRKFRFAGIDSLHAS